MQNLQVKDIMDREPASVHCEDSLVSVVEKLSRQHLTGLPVLDHDEHVIGFVSEKDCMKQMMISSYLCDRTPIVSEVMRHDVLAVAPTDNVLDLAKQMLERKPRIYPVLDGERLVGLIDRTRILAAFKSQQEQCGTW